MDNIINIEESKKYQDKKYGDLIPMEEWDGKCWKEMFDSLAEMVPDNDPWDTFAMFIKGTLMK